MWLFIVLILGTLIVLFEISVETVVIWLKDHNIIKMSCGEWFGNDTFQLQRLAHEELGLGNWEGCSGRVIPITRKGQLLGVFSIIDPNHLKLVDPNTTAKTINDITENDQSGGQVGTTAAYDSGTEINGSPSNASQNPDQNVTSHSNTLDPTTGKQDKNLNGFSPHSNSHSMTEHHPGIDQHQSVVAVSVEGQVVTQAHSSEQRQASPKQEVAPSPNSSAEKLDPLTVRESADMTAPPGARSG